jgi:hypothetical protein
MNSGTRETLIAACHNRTRRHSGLVARLQEMARQPLPKPEN